MQYILYAIFYVPDTWFPCLYNHTFYFVFKKVINMTHEVMQAFKVNYIINSFPLAIRCLA